MKKTKFTEAKIVAILKENEAGISAPELARKHGISQATFYKWKAKYGGMEVSDPKKLKEVESENRRLKQMYADLSLESCSIKGYCRKKALKPAERKLLVQYALDQHKLSIRKACELVNVSRSAFYYQAKPKNDEQIISKLRMLAESKPRWGFGKMFNWMRRKRYPWNHKRVHRVYCEIELNLRIKPKKRLPSRNPKPLIQPDKPNKCWSMDFMSDSLTSGRSFRVLHVIDDFNRELLGTEIEIHHYRRLE